MDETIKAQAIQEGAGTDKGLDEFYRAAEEARIEKEKKALPTASRLIAEVVFSGIQEHNNRAVDCAREILIDALVLGLSYDELVRAADIAQSAAKKLRLAQLP